MLRSLTLFALLILNVRAADWPMAGGDPSASNVQPHESVLSRDTIGGLTLLWRKHLGAHLSSPVILGHLVTHRGIQELIFVTSSDDTVIAIDADLGRVLWNRNLDSQPNRSAYPVTPAFMPNSRDEDDDNKPRPLFALSSHSDLYTLRTISGENDAPPKPLESSQANALRIDQAGVTAVHLNGSKPISANGLSFFLNKSQLVVLDEKTRKPLFSAQFNDNVSTQATLAVANGHVVFTTVSGDLYCFGLPIDF